MTSPGAPLARALLLALVFAAWIGACPSESAERRVEEGEPSRAVEPVGEDGLAQERASIAPERVIARPRSGDGQTGFSVLSAFVHDDEYALGTLVEARRIVYRVTLMMPPAFRGRAGTVPPPVAEIVIDVSDDRLRARFGGTGWPVDPGAEVRIRADAPGAYVFDSRGGRPLGPGQLSAWFQGQRLAHPVGVALRTEDVAEPFGAGRLVCRLLAEWTSQPPDVLLRRCGEGGAPIGFRMGLWAGTRTADVAVQLRRDELRADHRSPPELVPPDSSVLLAPRMLAQIEPSRPSVSEDPVPVLAVRNHSRNRILAVVNGIPIGWAGPAETFEVTGLGAGCYRIGALRPLGMPALAPRVRCVPGALEIGP